MTDQEFLMDVVSYLDRVCQTQVQLERLFRAEFESGAAIFKALDRNQDSYLPTLRREYERAYGAAKPVGMEQSDNLNALVAILEEWNSPGPEFSRFRQETLRVVNSYIETFHQLRETHIAMREQLLEALY